MSMMRVKREPVMTSPPLASQYEGVTDGPSPPSPIQTDNYQMYLDPPVSEEVQDTQSARTSGSDTEADHNGDSTVAATDDQPKVDVGVVSEEEAQEQVLDDTQYVIIQEEQVEGGEGDVSLEEDSEGTQTIYVLAEGLDSEDVVRLVQQETEHISALVHEDVGEASDIRVTDDVVVHEEVADAQQVNIANESVIHEELAGASDIKVHDNVIGHDELTEEVPENADFKTVDEALVHKNLPDESDPQFGGGHDDDVMAQEPLPVEEGNHAEIAATDMYSPISNDAMDVSDVVEVEVPFANSPGVERTFSGMSLAAASRTSTPTDFLPEPESSIIAQLPENGVENVVVEKIQYEMPVIKREILDSATSNDVFCKLNEEGTEHHTASKKPDIESNTDKQRVKKKRRRKKKVDNVMQNSVNQIPIPPMPFPAFPFAPGLPGWPPNAANMEELAKYGLPPPIPAAANDKPLKKKRRRRKRKIEDGRALPDHHASYNEAISHVSPQRVAHVVAVQSQYPVLCELLKPQHPVVSLPTAEDNKAHELAGDEQQQQAPPPVTSPIDLGSSPPVMTTPLPTTSTFPEPRPPSTQEAPITTENAPAAPVPPKPVPQQPPLMWPPISQSQTPGDNTAQSAPQFPFPFPQIPMLPSKDFPAMPFPPGQFPMPFTPEFFELCKKIGEAWGYQMPPLQPPVKKRKKKRRKRIRDQASDSVIQEQTADSVQPANATGMQAEGLETRLKEHGLSPPCIPTTSQLNQPSSIPNDWETEKEADKAKDLLPPRPADGMPPTLPPAELPGKLVPPVDGPGTVAGKLVPPVDGPGTVAGKLVPPVDGLSTGAGKLVPPMDGPGTVAGKLVPPVDGLSTVAGIPVPLRDGPGTVAGKLVPPMDGLSKVAGKLVPQMDGPGIVAGKPALPVDGPGTVAGKPVPPVDRPSTVNQFMETVSQGKDQEGQMVAQPTSIPITSAVVSQADIPPPNTQPDDIPQDLRTDEKKASSPTKKRRRRKRKLKDGVAPMQPFGFPMPLLPPMPYATSQFPVGFPQGPAGLPLPPGPKDPSLNTVMPSPSTSAPVLPSLLHNPLNPVSSGTPSVLPPLSLPQTHSSHTLPPQELPQSLPSSSHAVPPVPSEVLPASHGPPPKATELPTAALDQAVSTPQLESATGTHLGKAPAKSQPKPLKKIPRSNRLVSSQMTLQQLVNATISDELEAEYPPEAFAPAQPQTSGTVAQLASMAVPTSSMATIVPSSPSGRKIREETHQSLRNLLSKRALHSPTQLDLNLPSNRPLPPPPQQQQEQQQQQTIDMQLETTNTAVEGLLALNQSQPPIFQAPPPPSNVSALPSISSILPSVSAGSMHTPEITIAPVAQPPVPAPADVVGSLPTTAPLAYNAKQAMAPPAGSAVGTVHTEAKTKVPYVPPPPAPAASRIPQPAISQPLHPPPLVNPPTTVSSSTVLNQLTDQYIHNWRPTGQYCCCLCSYSCVTKNYLFRHWLVHHNQTLYAYRCAYCNFTATYKDGVTRHVGRWHRDKPKEVLVDIEIEDEAVRLFKALFGLDIQRDRLNSTSMSEEAAEAAAHLQEANNVLSPPASTFPMSIGTIHTPTVPTPESAIPVTSPTQPAVPPKKRRRSRMIAYAAPGNPGTDSANVNSFVAGSEMQQPKHAAGVIPPHSPHLPQPPQPPHVPLLSIATDKPMAAPYPSTLPSPGMAGMNIPAPIPTATLQPPLKTSPQKNLPLLSPQHPMSMQPPTFHLKDSPRTSVPCPVVSDAKTLSHPLLAPTTLTTTETATAKPTQLGPAVPIHKNMTPSVQPALPLGKTQPGFLPQSKVSVTPPTPADEQTSPLKAYLISRMHMAPGQALPKYEDVLKGQQETQPAGQDREAKDVNKVLQEASAAGQDTEAPQTLRLNTETGKAAMLHKEPTMCAGSLGVIHTKQDSRTGVQRHSVSDSPVQICGSGEHLGTSDHNVLLQNREKTNTEILVAATDASGTLSEAFDSTNENRQSEAVSLEVKGTVDVNFNKKDIDSKPLNEGTATGISESADLTKLTGEREKSVHSDNVPGTESENSLAQEKSCESSSVDAHLEKHIHTATQNEAEIQCLNSGNDDEPSVECSAESLTLKPESTDNEGSLKTQG